LQVQMSHAMQLGQAEAPLHVAGRAGWGSSRRAGYVEAAKAGATKSGFFGS
jgi:hypothetical protein